MDLFDLFFISGPALRSIFKYGFIPTREDFKELTEEQYDCYRRKIGDPEDKIYALLPDDPKHQLDDDYNELNIAFEYEIDGYQSAAKIIEFYCKDQNFETLTEKLQFMASQLPSCFTEGTPFEKFHNFKVIKSNKNKEE